MGKSQPLNDDDNTLLTNQQIIVIKKLTPCLRCISDVLIQFVCCQ